MLSAAGLLLALPAGAADEAAVSRSLAVVPSLGITQTLSNNHALSGTSPEADAITALSAGLSLRRSSGLLQGYMDFLMSGMVYARHSNRNEIQSALNGRLSGELIENRASIELAANISRSAISGFDTQPAIGGLFSSNATEVRTLQLSPKFRGPLGPSLRYDAALVLGVTDASKTRAGDSSSSSLTLHVEPSSSARLGWSVDGSHLNSSFKAGRSTVNDRLVGGLSWRLDDLDLLFKGRLGVESGDLASLQRETHKNWGVGAVWAPSPRTRLSADWDRRFFGSSHALSFSYRTPRTIWQASSTRSLSTGGGDSVGSRTLFEDLMNRPDLSAAVPDPARRAALVSELLRQSGRDGTALTGPSFLRSTATVDDRQELSFTLRGQRSTLVAALSRSKTRRLGTAVGNIDDLSNSADVRLDGLALDLSHRLTPVSSLTLGLSQQRGRGSLATQDSRQRRFSLQYATQLTPEASLSIGMRRALLENSQVPFGESALYATYGLRF